MNGYLSGLLSHSNADTKQLPQAAASSSKKITIAYGTETGNAKSLSTKLAAFSKKRGFLPKLISLEQYKVADLANEAPLLIVISTQGDGEPPVAAQKFYDYLQSNTTAYPQLSYAVLALGDSSYPLFCKTGEDIDTLLEKTTAKRFSQLIKCDTDYEATASIWFEQALQNIENTPEQPIIKETTTAPSHSKQIHKGIVRTHINLNDQGSSKETYHIEIASDAAFEPGDSIGILPPNPGIIVQKILRLLNINPNKEVSYKNEYRSVLDLLNYKLNITHLPIRVLKKYAEITGQEIPDTPMGLLDLLSIYPPNLSVPFEKIIQILEPNAPRLYSISSSPEAHSGEIHITVSRNKFVINETINHGLCSDYLSLFEPGKEIEFYIHPNHQFRLPDENRDVIMIGPGTGIAPFRSFLAEREATGASGRNWLFFGDQHFTSDFLYQTELQAWHETDLLTKINVAFSRDQQEKIYVQHKIKEQGAAFYEWLQSGAYIYICGSKDPMSKDVEATILEVIQTHGQQTEEQAQQYLETLKEDGHYHKDVY